MNNRKNKYSFAFTLAEVLITIGIIGVVATFTIPTLMNNIQDAQYKTAYKKSYTVLSQALISADSQDLIIENTSNADNRANFITLMGQLKIVKACVGSDIAQCWDMTGEMGEGAVGGRPYVGLPAFIDASGMAWTQISGSTSKFAVDTNGFKQPNQYGKDRFGFYAYDEKNQIGVGSIPIKVKPFNDNDGNCCFGNVCATQNNYYGTSWLMNKK